MSKRRRRHVTVRVRIAAAIFVVSVTLLVAMSLGVYWRFDSTLRASLDDAVQSRAEAASSLSALENGANVPRSGDGGEQLLRLYDSDGRLISDDSPGLAAAPGEFALVRGGGRGFTTIAYADGRYRLYAAPVVDRSGPTQFVVAGLAFEQVSDPLNSLRTILLIAVPLTALLLAAASYAIARRALRPVGELTTTATAIAAGDLERRIEVTSDDELGELARTFNTMIERLEGTILRERRFASDASHELRTPLAGMEAALDVTLSRTRRTDEYEETLRTIRQQVRRLNTLVNRLLLLARLDDGSESFDSQLLDAEPLVEAVVESFLEIHPEAHVTVSCAPELELRGDLALLASAFTNLLDNALRYGGPTTSVAIAVERANGRLQMDFSDDGPGIPADVRDTVFQRFRRGRSRDASGTGLGLAIVESVMKAHHGSVALVPTPVGTTVRLVFPLT